MKASVESWKLWGAAEEYPVLQIHCSKDELEATEALHRLNTICAGLRGLGFKQSLASISNPDAVKDQGTLFTIDLGTLLAMLASLETHKADREFAIGWLRSLSDKVVKKESSKKEVFTCRCGQEFKKEKLYKSHQKLCSVMARDFGLMLRVQESLKNLKKKGKSNGKKATKNRRVRQDNETAELQPKLSARSKRKSNRNKVHNRRQGRRT